MTAVAPVRRAAARRAETWTLPFSERAQAASRAADSRSRASLIRNIVIMLAAVCVLPFILDSYWLYLASSLLAYSIAVMGARILFGVTGILSVAQASFVGIGAYAAAIGSSTLGLSAVPEFLLVLVVSLLASLVVGLPALRIGGIRLVLLTLAFCELFQWWLIDARGVTGGTQGMSVASLYIPGLNTTDPLFLYGLSAACALIATLVLGLLPRTQIGRNMAAVRESEFAARSVGVKVNAVKITAFVVAGICAGISGFLVAHIEGAVTPTNYDMFASVYILVGVILGGSSSTVGAWLGAAYVSLAPPLFNALGADRLYVLISGALLVGLIYLLPGGLVQLGSLFRRRRATVRATADRTEGSDA